MLSEMGYHVLDFIQSYANLLPNTPLFSNTLPRLSVTCRIDKSSLFIYADKNFIYMNDNYLWNALNRVVLDFSYLAYGQFNAVKDMEEAVAVGPAADKYLHLARAYALAGRRDEARKALREAEAAGLDPGSLLPLERKGYDELMRLLPRP